MDGARTKVIRQNASADAQPSAVPKAASWGRGRKPAKRAAREELSRLDPETPRRDLGISSRRTFKTTVPAPPRGSPRHALGGRIVSQNWKRRPAIGSTEVWKR